MEQYLGWVRLYRNLHGSFSDNPKRDISCWLIYVHLLEKCMWKDGEYLKANEVKTSYPEIEKSLQLLTMQSIRTCLNILHARGFIESRRASKWFNSGMIFTVKTNMQLTCNQHATNMQSTCITEGNENEKEHIQKATNMQLTCNQHATNMSLEKKKEGRRKKEDNIGTTYLTPSDVIEVAEYWNQVVVNLPKIRTAQLGVLKKRLDSVKKVIGLFGIDDCRAAIDKASRSDFLNGRSTPRREGEKPFSAKFDWLMKVENMAKVLEGNYDNKKTSTVRNLDDD